MYAREVQGEALRSASVGPLNKAVVGGTNRQLRVRFVGFIDWFLIGGIDSNVAPMEVECDNKPYLLYPKCSCLFGASLD
jgi:hypothetical protein